MGVSSLLPAGWEPEVFKRTPDRSRLKTKLEAHYAMSMRPRGMISGACQFARGARKNTKLLRSLGVSPSEIGLFLKQTCRRFPPPIKNNNIAHSMGIVKCNPKAGVILLRIPCGGL